MHVRAQAGSRMLSVWSGMTAPSKERALELLEHLEWEELHLRLPSDWKDGLEALKEGFDLDSVVEEMHDLGVVRLPEDAQLVRSWKPFLEGIWDLAGEREVHCFRDPISFSHQRQIALDLATESIKARLGHLNITAWNELLREDAYLSITDSVSEAKIIAKSAGEEVACVDLSAETEEILTREGFQVHRVVIEGDQLPLSRLKREIILLESRGEDVPDSLVEQGIKEHLEFLEVLLSAKTFDEACLIWCAKGRETNGS
jgi:hypothetical protein